VFIIDGLWFIYYCSFIISVFRARIHEELLLNVQGVSPDEIIVPRYRIQISTIWKGRALVVDAAENDKADSKIVGPDRINTILYTSSSSCKLMSLSQGKKYILSGNIVQNKLYVTACHWHLLWDSRSKKIRRQLRRGDFHCRCLVEPCFSKATCIPRDNLTCVWPVKFRQRDCKFRMCRYKAGGCRWTSQIQMNVCEKSRRVYRLKSPAYLMWRLYRMKIYYYQRRI